MNDSGWSCEMTAAALVCGSCGTELPPASRFCNKCGAAVATATTSAEYKQVTVLFADVVHSMEIAAAVGAERLREIMAELVNHATAVVKQYGGTVDKFTGDGIMAVFGAPVALEDHAVRACLAALGIQQETRRLADVVNDRDGIDLRLRVGLNSGEVIAGELGSGPFAYTAVGEQVGMAQRMESAAPPGEVMLSASTARLVEGAAALGEPELVRIKGTEELVAARRLSGMGEGHRAAWRTESNLVGRRWELAVVEGLLDRVTDGHGAVASVVGSPGIGKSRLVREANALANARGIEVFSTFCESHATDIPFHAVVRLLRAVLRIGGLDDQSARARARGRVRAVMPDADPEDMLLLDDLVGIADPNVELPKIDPDARRRRLINATQMARTKPTMYVLEDAHWIDQVSESMIADFLTVIPRTPALVLITYRPEYTGALSTVPGAQSIALAPLTDRETETLVWQLLGSDPSVGGPGQIIAERAAGNPFFAEEMVRDLAERGVLRGERGTYISTTDVAEVSVPATVQATIAARIDRLDPAAKHTLSAAAVIGSRFSQNLLDTLGIDPALKALVAGGLINQSRFSRQPEYVFHHPLIRAVAYEAQLKSDRAEMHRRVAAAVEERGAASVDENAAMIAEHLEAAGDLHAAFGWHMRAARWATNRDIAAAQLSWERARKIADALPAEDRDRAVMRIAPRTMLCGIAWRVHVNAAARFDELRELCTAAGDKASLAIAMAGLVMDHVFHDRIGEALQLSSEAMALAESLGDATLTVGLSFAAIYAKVQSGEVSDVLRWSQMVIDLADGDPSKGNFIIGSPLSLALTSRAFARYWLGRPGWRDDLQQALVMARSADAVSYASVVTWVYNGATPFGVLGPDDRTVREIEDALAIAERSGDDLALTIARMTLGLALVHRRTAADRARGQKLLAEVSDVFLLREYILCDLPGVNVYLARERARHGDRDEAIPAMRTAAEQLFREGRLLLWGIPATGVLVETLLERGTQSDMAEAEAAIERLTAAPAEEGLVIRDIWLLRLRALLARTRGDEATYRDLRDRYRDMARTLGFEGHIAWAEAMA